MRYLRFNNIDMQQPEIISHCSQCEREFRSSTQPGEHVDVVLRRIRDAFLAHECEKRATQ